MSEVSRVDPTTFCWRPGAIARYESLWSLLHKFAAFNSADSLIIKRLLADQGNRDNPYFGLWKWRGRADLRDFGGFDPIALAEVFQTSPKALDESVIPIYLKPCEFHQLSCEELRYCLVCLQKGFHSVMYQLLFLINCPAHTSETLRTACPKCGAKIPYQIDVGTFKNPYSCSNCREPFTILVTDPRNELEMIEEEPHLASLHKWLRERKRKEFVEKAFPESRSELFRGYGTERKFSISDLLYFWSNSFRPSARNRYVEEQPLSAPGFHSYMTFPAHTPCLGQTTDHIALKNDLYYIYKSIRRFLFKRILAPHALCIEESGLGTYWDKRAITVDGKICVEANAYLLWRMFYEDVEHPIFLFKKFRPSPKYSFERSPIRWEIPAPNLPDVAIRKIFSLECYWTYWNVAYCRRTLTGIMYTLSITIS